MSGFGSHGGFAFDVVERSTSREWWISFSCKASCLKQCDRDNVEKN